ncbi:hypothetical protein NL466_28420, partial [Klebsiella pneumoniae]|nr:hypothetical protein [Klebsiella pneumoniae]
GAGGAPVLDRSGALVGLVTLYPTAPRLVAGVVPPARYGLVPGSAVAALLAEAGLRVAPPQRAGGQGAAIAALSGAIVAVTCQP